MDHPKLLLLEAEPIIAAHILALLASIGYDTYHASNTQEALGWCTQNKPYLALLNFHLDGLALALVLQSQFSIKTCFLTGCRQQDMFSDPRYNQNFVSLSKPFTQVQLKKTIAPFLP
jgi:CheY-like chemotaxis protein